MRKTPIALFTAAALIAIGCGSNPGAGEPVAAPITAETTTAAKAAAKTPKGLTAGTWEVPGEVKPGTYTTTADGRCYWARLKGFDGDLESILANGNLKPGERGRLTVKQSDKGVELTGDCVWVRAK